MALQSAVSIVPALCGRLTVSPLLQLSLEPTGIEGGLAAVLVLGLLMYAVYVAFSIFVGVLVLFVSEFVFGDSYVSAIEAHVYDHPFRSGAVGVGALLGGTVGIFLLMVVLLVLLELGLPEPAVLLSAVPFFAGMVLVYVGATVGTIVVGAYLLRLVGAGDPNLWIALVLGALVVNLPGLNVVLAFVVLFVGVGAMFDHWWQHRHTDRSGSNAVGVADD